MIRTMKSVRRGVLLALSGGLLGLGGLVPSAYAGKEGVFLDSATYFTLERASLASNSMQFMLNLHNGGDGTVDFNRYGVRVTDADGHSFTAKLSEKRSALVAAGQDQTFRFSADLAPGETADRLKVDIFEWDYSRADLRNEIGQLSVAPAVTESEQAYPQTLVDLHQADATLSSDAAVVAELRGAYRVHKGEDWFLYTTLSVQNLSTGTVKLPAALKYRLQDKSGYTYEATPADSEAVTLLPGGTASIVLQTPVPDALPEGLSLQFYYVGTDDLHVLGSVNVGGESVGSLGKQQSYAKPGSNTGLAVTAEKTTYVKQSDGVTMQTTVTVKNVGTALAAVPALTASYQFGDSAAVDSTDNSTRAAYLSPQEAVSYTFTALLPETANPSETQLVLWDKTSAAGTVAVPVAEVGLSGAVPATDAISAAQPYEIGKKLSLTSSSTAASGVDVSLMELHEHVNDEFGYKTAIAKFKMTNTGTTAVDLPVLPNSLIDAQGKTYTGTRQSTVAQQIMPGTSYVVSYSYLLPSSSKADKFALQVNEDKSSVSRGSFQVAFQQETDGDKLSFYPFEVDVKDHYVSWQYSGGNYTYSLSIDVDINHQDEVVVDQNFSQIEFDLVDGNGRIIGSKAMPFTGTGKIISGTQKITISNLTSDAIDSSAHILVYETVSTPNGTVKRLVKDLK